MQTHLLACSLSGLHLVAQPLSAPSPLQPLAFVQGGPPSHLHTGRLSWFVEKSKSQGWGEGLADVSENDSIASPPPAQFIFNLMITREVIKKYLTISQADGSEPMLTT